MTSDFESKTELDFRNRLIAKFAIPRSRQFWGPGFAQIPESALYPRGDKIFDVCGELRTSLSDEFRPGDLGLFIKEWAQLEQHLLTTARRVTERNVSIREAIAALAGRQLIPSDLADQIEALRNVRNSVVHRPETVTATSLHDALERLKRIAETARLRPQ